MKEMPAKPRTQMKGVFMLLATSLIWGAAFIAQSIGMDSIDAFTFNGVRSVLAVLALLPVVLWRWRGGMVPGNAPASGGRANNPHDAYRRKLLRYGITLGIVFFTASNLQQFAFYYTSAGKIAFLTALYIFFVPLLGLPFGKHIPKLMWPCVFAGFISLYFLCIRPGESFSLNRGDILAFLCSVFFAMQILLIERFTKEVDGVELSFIQLAVAGALALIAMFLFETPSLSAIYEARMPLLYAGILSSAVAYTLQIVGQKYTEATLASLIMCMESVFALVTAALILHEYMNTRELFGCVLLLGAIVAGTLVSGRSS